MLGSAILDVAVGIIFLFLLVSIICSAIREGIEAWLKTRAAYLERGIRELLHDRRGRGLARTFYEHPIIYSLYSHEYVPGKPTPKPPLFARGGGLPSYIPAGNFALALMDIAARGPSPVAASDHKAPLLSLPHVRASIANIDNEPVQRAMLTAIDRAQGDLDRAQKNIEAWFDSAMDRVSGWYKRSTQWLLFWIGLFAAIGLNINTITIADYLYRDGATRDAIVARAGVATADPAFLERGYGRATADLNGLNLPIGWTDSRSVSDRVRGGERPAFWSFFLASLPGWLLTALAAAFGAPFWFDLLNKMIVIRSTVKPQEKSPDEGSEDRKPRPSQRSARKSGHESEAGASRTRVRAELPEEIARHVAELVAVAAPQADDDGCQLTVTAVTRDEDLPAAKGG